MLSTVAELINHCGGVEKVASGLNVSLYTVIDWNRDNTIPAKHIKGFVDKFDIPADTLISFIK